MSCTTGGWARASVFVALVFAGRLNAAASQPPAADASPANNAITAYGSEGQYLELAKRVTRAQADQYSLILAEYEQYLAAHPQDVVARIEKCRFILEFADSDDFPVDTAADDSDRCREGLRAASFDTDGRVQIFLLEGVYGPALEKQAATLLPRSGQWTPVLQARLYERLADGLEKKDPELAATDLAHAVDLDPLSKRRIEVAQHFAKLGAKQRALQLIRSTPAAAWGKLPVYQAASLLIELGVPDEAAQLLRAHPTPGKSTNSAFLLAHALAAAGRISAARDVYSKTLESDDAKAGQRWMTEYFQFELHNGTRQQAEAAYRRLRESGAGSDPWGRYRLALFLWHPGAAWTIREAFAVLKFTALLAIMALIPALVVGPVHYRSSVKRLRGYMPEHGRWGLGAMWYALAVLLIVPTLASYAFAYDTFATLVSWSTNTYGTHGSDAAALGRMLLWQAIAMAVCTLPLLRGVDREMLLGIVPLRVTLGWALLALLLCGAMALAFGFVLRAYQHIAALGDLTTRAIQGVQSAYGTWAVLALIAILIPVIEEVMFRGVILQAMSRYISYGWAAVLQAALFAAMHEKTEGLPYVFVLGLLGAWLARRTGGLLAPMLLHGANNALVFVFISTVAIPLNGGA
jgi:uncharacterized protein